MTPIDVHASIKAASSATPSETELLGLLGDIEQLSSRSAQVVAFEHLIRVVPLSERQIRCVSKHSQVTDSSANQLTLRRILNERGYRGAEALEAKKSPWRKVAEFLAACVPGF